MSNSSLPSGAVNAFRVILDIKFEVKNRKKPLKRVIFSCII